MYYYICKGRKFGFQSREKSLRPCRLRNRKMHACMQQTNKGVGTFLVLNYYSRIGRQTLQDVAFFLPRKEFLLIPRYQLLTLFQFILSIFQLDQLLFLPALKNKYRKWYVLLTEVVWNVGMGAGISPLKGRAKFLKRGELDQFWGKKEKKIYHAKDVTWLF